MYARASNRNWVTPATLFWKVSIFQTVVVISCYWIHEFFLFHQKNLGFRDSTFLWMLLLWRLKFSILWSLTSKGHSRSHISHISRSHLYLKYNFSLIYFFRSILLWKLILRRFFFSHKMKFDLKGHTRSHNAHFCLKIYVFLDFFFV